MIIDVVLARDEQLSDFFQKKQDSWGKSANNLNGSQDEDAFAAFRTLVSLPFERGFVPAQKGDGRVQVMVIDTPGNAVAKTVKVKGNK